MADKSKIEWTDATWNPIRARNIKTGKVGWYCEHATTGCEFCYAEGMNKRLGTGLPFKPGHRQDVELFLDEQMLTAPLRWKKPRMIFPNSMTDLFAGFVPDEWIDKMFAIMALTPQHTYQPLTKRAERMRDYLSCMKAFFNGAGDGYAKRWGAAAAEVTGSPCAAGAIEEIDFPLPNVWLGVSTERQQEADERIPLLLQTPAAVRFISAEPLLGPLVLAPWLALIENDPNDPRMIFRETLVDDGIDFEQQVLDWVIVGGESGPKARPVHIDWVRSLRDQCAAAGVPFFKKQWGEWLPWSQFTGAGIDDDPEQTRFATCEWEGDRWEDAGRPIWCDIADGAIDDEQCVGRVGKARAGRLLDGVEHNGFPTSGDHHGV